ncbi:hypothetical protein DXF87_26490, partial [Enterobacter roggenkampii]
GAAVYRLVPGPPALAFFNGGGKHGLVWEDMCVLNPMLLGPRAAKRQGGVFEPVVEGVTRLRGGRRLVVLGVSGEGRGRGG